MSPFDTSRTKYKLATGMSNRDEITVPKGKQFGYFDNQLHNIGWPFNIVPHNTGSTVLLSEK